MIIKKIEAYQTSDGKKFFDEQKARNHREWLKYKVKKEDVKHYLLGLLKMKDLDDGQDKLYNMMSEECRSVALQEMELEEISEMIFDIATVLDGALLKTAQYMKEVVVKP